MILVLTILIGAWDKLLEPVHAGLDTFTFFWPMYAFLGEELRRGNVPGWNPYQFSGVPFAADPESGWMYVPAMLVFTLLPLGVAIKVYAVAHILIAGAGTYLYGRVIGLVPAGALVSAWAISQGGLFSDRSRCCYTHIQVAAWIPLALLGVELAVRATARLPRVLAWLLTGIAISQMISGWIGQGAMYGVMLVGGYIVFRTLAPSPQPPAPIRTRLFDAARHGIVPLALGVGLAAPGILPRLAYYGDSSLASGYIGTAEWAREVGGWTAGRQVEMLLQPKGWFFVGAVVMALSVLAVMQPLFRRYVAFFLALTVVSFILGLERPTPLHDLLFALVPPFEDMHVHFPERIALVLQFGPAMLAGIGVTAIVQHRDARAVTGALATVAVAAGAMAVTGLDLSAQAWVAVVGVILLLAVLAWATWSGRASAYRIATIGLALALLVELQAGAWSYLRTGAYARVVPAEFTEPNDTATFILGTDTPYPPRVFGYDPFLTYVQHEQITYYRHAFQDPLTVALLVNNRGTLWNISDVQGYNPLQLQGYVDFFTSLNGQPQEYHGSYVLPSGLDSPLLPLLAPDYVVVPLVIPHDRPDLLALVDRYPQVATTDHVRILRYTDAFPRAWVVHDIRAFDGNVATALAQGPVDSRRTALVAGELPPVDAPSGTRTESATITAYSADAMTVDVTSDGDGLLVLSEVYADGWTASVDGRSTDVIAVNGALRGVPVPDGAHTVTLTFTPPGLETGLWIGLATVALAAGEIAVAAILDRRRPAPASGGERRGRRAAGQPA